LKLLPPYKGGEGREKKGREREGEGMKGKEWKRTSERSLSSKFVTTPLILTQIIQHTRRVGARGMSGIVKYSVHPTVEPPGRGGR